ncbi:MAG: tRNA epoxyqueuosine(34) reductase QueG [Gemmatimonadota bacterium]
MSGGSVRHALREHAAALGFSTVGVTRPDESDHIDFYRKWLSEGYQGEMSYLAREDAVRRRSDPAESMADVASVIVVAHEYAQEDSDGVPGDPSLGVIARYARGRDYHRVMKKKLLALLEWLDGSIEGGVRGRAYVDTGPILERELGLRGGLGWFGKNTMLIHPTRGSYFFLGVLLVDVELPVDEAFSADRCGTCRACLDSCPTGALLGRNEKGAPVMDARRCISYLTIEHRGPIPVELRPLMGNRIYGCDICQEVCPYNNDRFVRITGERDYMPRVPQPRDGTDPSRSPPRPGTSIHPHAPAGPPTDAPPLVELMRMTREEWDRWTRGSAIRRAGYAGLKRNVAVALGNWLASVHDPPEEAVAVLRAALEDEESLVREHAAWALSRADER